MCAQAGNKTLICGDFNCPGHDHLSINETLATLLDSFDLEQHVNGPTRNQNILDLMITAGGSSTVDIIQIHDAGMLSDHRLVTCFLPVTKMKPRKVEYTFRDIKHMNLDEFRFLMRESTLFTNPETTTDSYAEQ